MKHILFLTDFSDTARNSIVYGMEMFKNKDINFYILNAYNIETPGSPYILQIVEDLKMESEKGLRAELDIIKNKYPSENIQTFSIYGSLVESINKISEEKNKIFDLIILGCRGETIIENIFLGSNAFDVVKYINNPLIVVPQNAVFYKPKKITFAADFNNLDDNLLHSFKMIVSFYDAEIIFANVGKEYDIFSDQEKKQYNDYFQSNKISFYSIEESDIHKGIIKFNDNQEGDLIVLIRNNYSFIERFFKPSLTKKMIMRSHKPMIIFHNIKK